MKRSAGILVYRKQKDKIQLFLTRMAGPYWEGINEGAWSIPKGERTKKEKTIDCAKREFNEETGLKVDNELHFLGSKKVSHQKLVTIFITEQDLNEKNFHSNFFTMEYPLGSGVYQEFPEMDQGKWMDIEEAKKLIIKNQLWFIRKLEKKIKK